jgi:carbon storage regulator CsrA
MLVLARYRDQSIVIRTPSGETITLTVVETRHDRVRIGIDAAPDVHINRSEIDEAKRKDGAITA